MAKEITMYEAEDGSTHRTAEAADRHDKTLAIKTEIDRMGGSRGTIDTDLLYDVLTDESDDLTAAVLAYHKER